MADYSNSVGGPKASADRLDVLVGALRGFAEATADYHVLLEVIAETLARVVKDGCIVRLLSDDGWLHAAAVHLPLEAKIKDARVVARLRGYVAAPHRVSEQASARRVLETGDPLLVPHLDIERIRGTSSPEVVEVYETIGIHSLLIVALRVRGESIGLLSLIRFEPESQPFGDRDRALAQALADHAALAISNARLLQARTTELSERRRTEAALVNAEEQLRHSQKMEAVGRLAGSVAHDFNNLLSVILGRGSLLLEDLKQTEPIREEIAAMVDASERASRLTRQLLAFSRQQVLEPRTLDLRAVVKDLEEILLRLLGEDIEIGFRHARGALNVRIDPSQMDQVLMNLAVNARDAMVNGGKLTIETDVAVLDETYASTHFDVMPGTYAMLAVSDTGTGMDRVTLSRIFEPFFTTKEKGKGTGLGLAMVFGIVKQSGGSIYVYSEPGAGTTFRLYFPLVGGAVDPVPTEPPPATLTGDETILVTEDQDAVRRVACDILRRYGYHVLEARNAGEALLICEGHPLPIHLLVTDVVMPKMSGSELATRLLSIRPELRVLYMSGYTDNAVVWHGILEPDVAYFEKPIVPATFARRVREVLDRPLRRSNRPPDGARR